MSDETRKWTPYNQDRRFHDCRNDTRAVTSTDDNKNQEQIIDVIFQKLDEFQVIRDWLKRQGTQ
jgi:hypothetical protein